MEVFNYNIFFVLITGLQPTLVRAFLMDAIAFYGFSLALHALDDV
jgi:predicted membrane metal-binding protein